MLTSDGRDTVNGLQLPPYTPSYDFETFSTTFEDPFSYSTTRQYETAPDPEAFNEEASAPELDNKLLGFSAPLVRATVVDETGQFAEMNMTSELFGMFFVAEDVYNADSTGRPLELTCYRRNLWQCSGQITLPRHVAHLVSEQGLQIPVLELAASITAIESIEGKPTEIISIPWKSSNPNNHPGNPPAAPADDVKVAGAPPNLPLDLSSGQELDSSRVSIPVSWKRLQFKHATANNGRRKGLQQHYVVQINLLGKTKSGEWIKIAEIQSGPVIVRGRSPRNFDSRKDVPLSGDKKLERRSLSSENTASVGIGTPHKQERGDLAQNLGRYHSLGNIQVLSPRPPYLVIPPTHESTSSRRPTLPRKRHPTAANNPPAVAAATGPGARASPKARRTIRPRKWRCRPTSSGRPCRPGPRTAPYRPAATCRAPRRRPSRFRKPAARRYPSTCPCRRTSAAPTAREPAPAGRQVRSSPNPYRARPADPARAPWRTGTCCTSTSR